MAVIRVPGALLGGAAAGAAGTLAMDLLWFRRARSEGDDPSFGDWEFSDASSFDEAGAPGQVGRLAAETAGIDLSDRQAGLTTDVVHWMTGVGWATAASLLTVLTPVPPIAAGVLCGCAAFGTAYTILPALGIYDPIWEYSGKSVRKDATAHLTYGAATGLALAVLSRLPVRVPRHRNEATART